MAEGGEELSFVSGSEAVFEFYCEFCNEEGLHKEAEGYCTDCVEYLCGSCVSIHKRTRAYRHHEILDKENMPRNTPPSSDRVRKDIWTMCKQHKGKPVEYYCKYHDELTCSECIIEDHKTCTNTVNIRTSSNSIFNDVEYKDFIQKLKSLEKQVKDITTKSREQSIKSERCCSEAIEAVMWFRAEINTVLDNIESSLKTQAEDIKTKDVAKMDTLKHTCSTIQEIIDAISSELESLKSENRVCQAYIKMKETSIDVEKIEQKLAEAGDINTITTFTFVPNTELTDFIRRPVVLGLLSMENKDKTKEQNPTSVILDNKVENKDQSQTSIITDNKVEKKEQRPVPVINPISSASFVQKINVRSTSDGSSCWISGSAVLSSSKLVVVDYNNGKVKLVDTRSMKIISELQVSGWPCDVTAIKEDQVAVTDYSSDTILILKLTDTITEERQIKVNGLFMGIVFSKNQLVVTYVDPPYIEIMDVYGNVNSKIESDKDGNKLFIWPEYVCASSDGDTLYVSDYSADKVVSLSRDGSVKAVYTDSNLNGPRKVCVDHRGNVFVCGYCSKNIHMLTPDCTKIKVILDQTDGLTSRVISVSHCRQTDRLYVGVWENDNVKVYQLS